MPRSLAEIEEFLWARSDALSRNPTHSEEILRLYLPFGNGWIFQHPMILVGPRGKVHGVIFDFYHEASKTAVELDGRQHKKGPDGRRDRAAANIGILTLRFPNKRIERDLPAVIKEIEQTVKERLEEQW